MAPRKQPRRAAKDDTTTTGQNKKLTTKAAVQKAESKNKNAKKGAGKNTKRNEVILNQVINLGDDPKNMPVIRKRGGRKRGKNFMDEFLASEEPIDQLSRSERWIPDMESRLRPTTKPDSVPLQLWMSYCMMDEFVYRQSLTDEEILALPLIDDVFLFKQGGPMPSAPPGFHWDDEKNLVPSGLEVSPEL